MAADAITPNHPLWHAIDAGAIRVDGNLGPAEWAGAQAITRSQPNDPNSRVTLKLKYSAAGLYVGVEVLDTKLWADGLGGGSGNRWEFWHDDSIALYFDPKNSRRVWLPATGRAFSFNIGGMNGPLNGPGAVQRWNFQKGDGKGGIFDATADHSFFPGMKWAVKLKGTVNNNSDVDTGWNAEAFLPWGALGMAGKPANGQTIGMTFSVMFDDDGGQRTPMYFGQSSDAAQRLGDLSLDDDVEGTFSSESDTVYGWKGPVSYAVVQFVDRAATDRPRPIANLTAAAVTGYGARLNFTAPVGSLSGRGNVAGYEIRYSSAPIITESDWQNAAVVQNNFTAHLRNLSESLRIGELTPSTTYFMAVRARDFAGRLSDIASTTFTTLSTAEDTTGGQRVMVSPNGNGLMLENGQPFVVNGGTLASSNLAIRPLYGGLLWDGTQMVDYSAFGNQENATEYFQALASYGVNNLRLQLEWVRLDDTPQARAQLPDGMRWLEWRQPGDSHSTFNPAMRDFLHSVMQEAANAGIHLFLQTFNNFNYREYFELTPFAQVNGGPLTSMDDFYWNPQVLQMAKQRLRTLADWVHQSPYSYTVYGFDLLNEWDGHDTSRDILTELRQRSWFHTQLAADLRSYAPDIVISSSSINLSPRGPVGRVLYYSDAFDMLNPHFYTNSVSEPVNIVGADKSVKPAVDYGTLAAYWLNNRRDSRPVQNSEWDLWPTFWPGGEVYYTDHPEIAPVNGSKSFTLAQDEAMFRTVNWTSIASGLVGGGQRSARMKLVATYQDNEVAAGPISKGMRQIQRGIANFENDNSLGFDWTNYRAVNLAGRVSATPVNGDRMVAFASADDKQGLAYVLRDGARSTGDALVHGSMLKIQGLQPGGLWDVQFWSTGPGAAVIGTLDNVVSAATTSFALPDFNTDVMVKFVRVG